MCRQPEVGHFTVEPEQTDELLFELVLRFHRGFLLGASTLEYASHGVIALMTRVLIDWPWRLRQRNFTFPDARKCRRIVDRELVHDGVLAGARKTLDQVQ